jgi:hypothetical protein
MVAVKQIWIRELRFLLIASAIALVLVATAHVVQKLSYRKLLEFQIADTSQKKELERWSILSEKILYEDSLRGNIATVDSLLLGMAAFQLMNTENIEFLGDFKVSEHPTSIWGNYPPEYRLSLNDSINLFKAHLITNLSEQNNLLKRDVTIFQAFIGLIHVVLMLIFPGRWLVYWLQKQ